MAGGKQHPFQKKARRIRKKHRVVRINSTEESRYQGTGISDGSKCNGPTGLIKILKMLEHIQNYIYKVQIEHIQHRKFASRRMKDIILCNH